MQDKEPDVVVSLGTGVSKRYEKEIEKAQEQNPAEAQQHLANAQQHLFKSRFLPRLFRSFMMLLDGQRTWYELWNSLPLGTRDRYHRLNTEFDGPEPQLDDIGAMKDLEQQTMTSAVQSRSLDPCADNLIASLFYLELDGLPTFEKRSFRCRAHICSRWSPTNLALLRLVSRMKKTDTKFDVNGRIYTGADDVVMDEVNNRRPFQRHILGLDPVSDLQGHKDSC